MEKIIHYFPQLNDTQIRMFVQLGEFYPEWNAKINVISRKDIEQLYEHHILHSLAIAKILSFKPGTTIVDIGTGGGFPGIPLAIMFPEVSFYLVDSIGKKIRVATEIANSIGLKNVTFSNSRMESEKGMFDFAVSRAAMPLSDLVRVCKKNIKRTQNNALPNGLICLKGGELNDEIQAYKKIASMYELSEFFEETYFETKKAIYLPL
ncbi:MAG: 16S rRNA (guanine(527)-N(7))-methyltransferase RsmG [Bacteroidia bacterium]|nr:16S rRNA (guanine(527)-N(7))-methyltransferase RsmG [Bacteroidia bacterium]